jgi:hypothetical protein
MTVANLRGTPLAHVRAAVALAFLLLFAALSHGQTTLGTILGHITDPSGAAVPNVSMQLRNEATNVTTTTVATSEGDYVFANVKPGTYELTLTADGFAPETLSHIVLEVSQTVRYNVALRLSAVEASVQVKAAHALVQTDTTSVGGVIESTQVRKIPLNGRTNSFGLLALAPGVQSASTNPRISGSSWIGTYASMDGVINMETENARLSNADPSLESLNEFRVIDSTGSAEYGGGTAQVIMSTKSGTNELHGSLFAYNRNRAFAAKNFFATSLPKPPFNRNEFGGSLGGPIIRNKVFFFGSYEGFTFRSSSTNLSEQPTTALLQGDFTGLPPVIDPYTQAPFPNNQIPAARISPVAKGLFPYFSTPNQPSSAPGGLGTNYLVNVASEQHNHRYQGRVDYAINPNNNVFARYFYVDRYALSPGVTEKIGADSQPLKNQSLAVNYTRVLSPTLVNVATFGWMRLTDLFLSQHHDIEPSSLIPGIPKGYPGLGGVPTVSIDGFTGLADDLGSGDTEPTYQFSDTLTWVTGKHTFKGGMSYLRYQFFTFGNQDPQYGAVSFTGQYTGNAFADFLLGYVAGSQAPLAPSAIETRNHRFGFFFQDDWRLTDRLTLNLGLRYDLPTLYQNTKGSMVNWYPELNSLVVLSGDFNPDDYPSLPIVSGQSVGLNTGNYIGNDLNQLAPRLGVAWRPLGSTALVVRTGYGMYYELMPWKFGSFWVGINPPFAGTRSFEPQGGSTPSLFLDDAFPAGSGTLPTGIGITALPKNYDYPLTHQWNLTLESQVSANTVLRASYLGSEREHSGGFFPINTPDPAPGPVQPRRPFQPFGPITRLQNDRTSNTQQLQLSAQRRYSAGLSFGVEYAWTKTLNSSLFDQGFPTDPKNVRADRGNDPQIRQHYLVANYFYELPVGRDKRFLSSLSAPLEAILGGWQTSGVVTLGSGLPYSVVFNSNVEGWPSSRADIVGDPHVSNPTLQRWFNPDAYAVPAPFQYGDSAPNSLFGPGFSNWDLAFLKTFPLRGTWGLEFRAELFNALNHPNFGNPNGNISTSQVGTVTRTVGSPRVVQFALRLDF